MSKQDQQEQQGKELTKMLLREWKDYKKHKRVAGAEKVTVRDASRKPCLSGVVVCHQRLVT